MPVDVSEMGPAVVDPVYSFRSLILPCVAFQRQMSFVRFLDSLCRPSILAILPIDFVSST